uniref:RNA ligase domain-containing protein n=1 Tax=Spumella elongata TaxID=89044 RepID=A0A7S3H891_9STRA|mmetsp:Transcript_39740/g.68825  ORF Transcript_39740/g.68825 Transcript_39740/m.68825 type:complete len:351 (+) Transcript_39740:83-1135(+)
MDTVNLAYVVRVLQLLPIPGKDLIELAVIKGWKCIVKKGEFAVGDLAIYLAIGSVPDFEDANFAFLKQKNLNRIKTIKMGGVISQGLLGPLVWLTARGMTDLSEIKEGDDVATAMGVTKYIPPEESGQYAPSDNAKKRDPFPDYVPKTDATRLQHAPDYYFEAIAGKEIVITRKEDGCSATFICYENNFMLCGRNFVWDTVDAGCAHYFSIAAQYGLADSLPALGRNLAIQGEICGPKINANRHKLTQTRFSVFDIYDIDQQQYLGFDDMCAVCTTLGLTTVPLLYRGPATGAVPSLTVDAFLQLSENTLYGPGIPAEGIVVKLDPVPSDVASRVVFKVISNKYLIKYDL